MAKTKKKAKAKKPAKKPAKKKATKKKAEPAKKVAARKAAPAGLDLAPELNARLRMLATYMGKTMDQLMLQALTEFCETWEDHQRTIAALKDTDDRVQLSVPKE
jgi:hypothetical protein